MVNTREPCLMCHGREQLEAYGYDLKRDGAPVCADHGAQLDALILADGLAHPDGDCHEDCGCVTFEDLDEMLAHWEVVA